jgi:hypothetical protein
LSPSLDLSDSQSLASFHNFEIDAVSNSYRWKTNTELEMFTILITNLALFI